MPANNKCYMVKKVHLGLGKVELEGCSHIMGVLMSGVAFMRSSTVYHVHNYLS